MRLRLLKIYISGDDEEEYNYGYDRGEDFLKLFHEEVGNEILSTGYHTDFDYF